MAQNIHHEIDTTNANSSLLPRLAFASANTNYY